jgi:predicted RNA-binding protein with EMAP domain
MKIDLKELVEKLDSILEELYTINNMDNYNKDYQKYYLSDIQRQLKYLINDIHLFKISNRNNF